MPSQEKTPPTGTNHYAAKYWNDLPEIRSYLCRNATGDNRLWWIPYFKQRYAQKPFATCLIIACGNGRIERELYDNGIALEFDAFDYSDTYLNEARAKKGTRPINYFKSSFESLSLQKKYDLVVNVAALHHVECLEALLEKIALSMPPYGMFVNWDYVGPNRNQYTDEHLKLMESVNASLPPKYQTKHPLRHPLETYIQGDITEAIRSAEILPAFETHFEMIERHNLGGGVAYQLLWNNIEEFTGDDPEAKAILQKIIDLDERYTQHKVVPNLFAFFIGSPRQASREEQARIAAFYHQRLGELQDMQKEENNVLRGQMKNSIDDKEAEVQPRADSFIQKMKRAFGK